MPTTNEEIDRLLGSDLQKNRDKGLALSYRQNTEALNALSARGFDLQRTIGNKITDLNGALDRHREETSDAIDKLTSALAKADTAGEKVSRASNRLTLFLVIATIVQAIAAVIIVFKK